MVDAAFLAAMPDGALLVNAARGVVVDTDALLAELTDRPAAGRPRRDRPRAAAAGASAVVGAGPAARRRTWAAPCRRPTPGRRPRSSTSWPGSSPGSRWSTSSTGTEA